MDSLGAESNDDFCVLFVESCGLDFLLAESNDDFCVLLAESGEDSCVLFVESGADFLFVESALDLSHFSASRQSLSLSLSLVTPHC